MLIFVKLIENLCVVLSGVLNSLKSFEIEFFEMFFFKLSFIRLPSLNQSVIDVKYIDLVYNVINIHTLSYNLCSK